MVSRGVSLALAAPVPHTERLPGPRRHAAFMRIQGAVHKAKTIVGQEPENCDAAQ